MAFFPVRELRNFPNSVNIFHTNGDCDCQNDIVSKWVLIKINVAFALTDGKYQTKVNTPEHTPKSFQSNSRPGKRTDLGHHIVHELLTPESRFDRHDEHHVHVFNVRHNHLHVRPRLQPDPHLLSGKISFLKFI